MALDMQATVRFLYAGKDGTVTRRMVDPAKIEAGYLLAWCCHREDIRRFRLSSMFSVEVGPGPNEIHLPLGEPEVLG